MRAFVIPDKRTSAQWDSPFFSFIQHFEKCE